MKPAHCGGSCGRCDAAYECDSNAGACVPVDNRPCELVLGDHGCCEGNVFKSCGPPSMGGPGGPGLPGGAPYAQDCDATTDDLKCGGKVDLMNPFGGGVQGGCFSPSEITRSLPLCAGSCPRDCSRTRCDDGCGAAVK